jgi:hypothetical protein
MDACMGAEVQYSFELGRSTTQPVHAELPQRLDVVLRVVYLVSPTRTATQIALLGSLDRREPCWRLLRWDRSSPAFPPITGDKQRLTSSGT